MKGLNWTGLLPEIKWLPINRGDSQTKDAYLKEKTVDKDYYFSC
jgi:hypothetical protein